MLGGLYVVLASFVIIFLLLCVLHVGVQDTHMRVWASLACQKSRCFKWNLSGWFMSCEEKARRTALTQTHAHKHAKESRGHFSQTSASHCWRMRPATTRCGLLRTEETCRNSLMLKIWSLFLRINSVWLWLTTPQKRLNLLSVYETFKLSALSFYLKSSSSWLRRDPNASLETVQKMKACQGREEVLSLRGWELKCSWSCSRCTKAGKKPEATEFMLLKIMFGGATPSRHFCIITMSLILT